jgi:RND family efflux transporter MFP subunit
VEVNLGDTVEQDQVLARLDPEPFELAVRDAEAALAEIRAFRQEARTTFRRFEEVAEHGAVSLQELDQARATRDSRESQFEAAEARLNLARRDLRRSVLRAPFPGSVSVREIDPAMKVGTGQTAFELDSEESGLRVEVQMPETLITRTRQGDSVRVSFPSVEDPDAETKGVAGVISEVGTRAGTGNAFPVRADLLDRPPALRPGMTAEVTFSFPRTEAGVAGLEGFLIPIGAALAEAGDDFSVFVFDPGTSTLEKRAIRTGGVRDNDVAVLDGLNEGDIIATAGVPFLRDGQEVRLLDEQLIRSAR